MAKATRDYWNQLKTTGLQVVPPLALGFDVRPAVYPGSPFWANGANWFTPATPAEITNQVQAAGNWIKANPKSTQPNTILIYAFNEFGEGGWAAPGLYNDNGYLNAISAALTQFNRK